MEEYKKLLKLAAYLLEYPSEAWWQDFDAYRAAAAEIETKQAREVLEELLTTRRSSAIRLTKSSMCALSSSRRTRIFI